MGFGIDFRNLFAGNFSKVLDLHARTAEFWGPMAQAVCFGLAFATVLTLVLVPVMYLSQEQMKNKVLGIFGFGSDKKPSGEVES